MNPVYLGFYCALFIGIWPYELDVVCLQFRLTSYACSILLYSRSGQNSPVIHVSGSYRGMYFLGTTNVITGYFDAGEQYLLEQGLGLSQSLFDLQVLHSQWWCASLQLVRRT